MSPVFLILPIMLPVLFGGLLIFIRFRSERLRCICSEAMVLLTSVLVWICILFVQRSAVKIYSFAAGFDIELKIDGCSMLFAGMVSVMWPLVMLYAFEYMKKDAHHARFFGFYVMTYGITLGVAFSENMITLYVFYEILSLVTIPLVMHYQDHESMFAGRKYAAYTIGGASLAFFAVIMTTVYGHSGDFIYGGSMIPGGMSPVLTQVAFLFGFFGFGVKAAIFPLHSWLPTASAAPTPVTALLHAVAVVNSGVFAVARMSWYVFDTEDIRGSLSQRAALAVSAFTIVFAAVMAVKERHFKKRLAWSTISNLSYMLFGIVLFTPQGFSAGLTHMLFHGIIKMSLFLCAGAFMHVTGREYIYEINGAGRKMPVTFAVYSVSALSLTGIPLLCGFVSKWKLVSAGFSEGSGLGLAGAVCLIASAFLCAVYTLTVSVRAFFPEAAKAAEGETLPEPSDDKWHEMSRSGAWLMLAPMLFFAALNIFFGLMPGSVSAFIDSIASGLM